MNLFRVSIIVTFLALNGNSEEIASGDYFVSQTWSQETNYKRPYLVKVPDESSSDSHPVLIFLHGNGGNAKGSMNGFMNRYRALASNYILVFAQGYKASWNIVSERAQSDDLGFIEEIVKTLAKFDNVQSDNFTIMGNSNGAALVNQIGIETKLTNIKNLVCGVSQLNGYQHDGKNFKLKGPDNNYLKKATPLIGKRILNISGSNDRLVPYHGGRSKVIPAKEGKLPFVDAEESIFLWAKHYGYTGTKLKRPTSVKGNLEKFSYLEGNVIHYKVVSGGHGAGGALSEDMLLDFLKGN